MAGYGWLERASNVFNYTDNTSINLYGLCNLVLGVGRGGINVGNNLPTAAVYVNSNNQIGINTLPTGAAAVTTPSIWLPGAVSGNAVQLSTSNITMISNFVTTFEAATSGATRCPMFLGDDFKIVRGESLSNVFVHRVHSSNVTSSNTVTPSIALYIGTQYYNDLFNATNILIKSQPLKVLFIEQTRFNNQPVIKVVATNLLPNGTANIDVRPGDNLKIEFIDNITSTTQSAIQTQTGITYTSNAATVTIQNYNYTSNNPLYPNSILNISFSAPTMDSQLVLGGFYSLSFGSGFNAGIPLNFLVLKDVQISTFQGLIIGTKLYSCVFQSAAKAEDLRTLMGDGQATGTTAYLYPYLTAPVPPRGVTESNVVVGFARESTNQTTNLFVSSPSISRITAVGVARNELPLSHNYDLIGDLTIPKYDSYISRGLDILTVDDTTTYDVVYHERIGEDPSVYLTVSNPPSLEQSVVMRRRISYDLLGIPLNITSINIINSTTVTYEFTTPVTLPTDKSAYNLAFVIDYPYSVSWQLKSFRNTSITLTVADSRIKNRFVDILEIPYINELRTIFIIPYTSLQSVATLFLGNSSTNVIVPKSLCVGTSNLISPLTIYGEASINNSLFVHDVSTAKPASLTYTQGNISLGISGETPNITISNDIVNISENLNVINNITCKQLFQLSDCNLKTNISPSDPMMDFRRLLNINVYQYKFRKEKEGGNTYKGVLAQEVAKLLPDAVKEVEYFTDLFIPVHIFGEIVSLAEDEMMLPNNSENITRIVLYSEVTDKYFVHQVTKSLSSGTWEVDPMPDINITHLSSFVTKTLTVNYDYLFTMTMNSLKAIDKRLHSMEKELLDLNPKKRV